MSGELAVVLHTHMPYVEGYGTWPFGEEWLWEAIATSYVPLLDVLETHGDQLTLSITPVLADQLEVDDLGARFDTFVTEVRRRTHAADIETAASPAEAEALRHSLASYEAAAERMRALGGDLLGALAPHVAWTSSATHAVLPLLATDAGVRLQLQAGIDSHRRRFGEWRGGLWLPECAHDPALDLLLEEAGVHAVCVDFTDTGLDPLRPLRSAAGPLLVPIDREVIELVWSEGGYPGGAAYRDTFRRTPHDHLAHAVDGSPYDPDRARETARADARDFVTRVRDRVAGGGLCVFAIDTELLGHWWHEGPWWLAAVLEEAAAQGLPVTRLDDALHRHEPVPAPDLPVTTWGTPRDLTTWSAPAVADLAWAARDAELRVIAAGARADDRAVRELLALQSSDWAFMTYRDLSAPYAAERVAAHREALETALSSVGSLPSAVRNLAPDASPAALLVP
ncbi:MAG: DUF1957 domain-containing protein [Solirubrobacteraceae bacterium]|nr:DUF1957 domain-containing protein [Solirubrobacteraceae bacterium]